MQAQWRNAARTILALIDETGHVIIAEPGHALWASASARPDIAPFAPEPVPEPEPEDPRAAIPPLTRRQVFIALHRLGLITATEAVAAAATGEVPAALEPMFAALPEPDQTDARVTFAAFQMAYRLDPMTAMIAASAGMTEEQIDAIWTGFASV
ncbi:hypothetical protein C0V75_00325 [Tabrizicola sp. TH137]|uniref:hypothetical protein n=1 Tax=Tabrizicola sp. TH137 TaxID=2067452 RepID=UPI000C7C8D46|nr:hypothetical protein [Tabrizicola sp. TH137]PLL13943.1 hypothetical protein C0V75_00325 [Tabrizicola sp. TH137]